MSETIELKVRFDPESQEIQVVANNEVLGVVEREFWSTWPADWPTKVNDETTSEEVKTEPVVEESLENSQEKSEESETTE